MAEAPPKGRVQDVAAQAIEAPGADTVVVGGLRGVLAGPPVVAGARVAGAVGGELALGPREGPRAQTLGGALLAQDARAAVETLEAEARPRIVLTGGAAEALKHRERRPPSQDPLVTHTDDPPGHTH